MSASEKLVDGMKEGIEKIIIIIDMNHFSLSTFPSIQTSHKTVNILQNHYPGKARSNIFYRKINLLFIQIQIKERLGQGFLVQPPLLFYGLWKVSTLDMTRIFIP